MPFGAAAAAVAGGVASAGASALLSGKQSGQAAQGASQARADLLPFTTAGTNALAGEGQFQQAGQKAVGVAGDLSGANGPDAATAAMANFYTDPGYQFQLQQGQRSIDAGAASKGILRSGGTIKAEDAYGQGVAAQDFGNYYNRLFNLSQLGEKAGSNLTQLGETAAAGGASLAQGAGNTQANITGNLGAGLSNTVSSLFSNPKVVSGINSLFNQQSFGNNTNPFNSSTVGDGSGGLNQPVTF